jgi:hypothetical protein
MIKIEVTAEVIAPSKENRPRKQVAYAYTLSADGKPNAHPEKTFIALWNGQNPYPVGTYTLAPQSIYLDRFRELTLSPKLQPVAAR